MTKSASFLSSVCFGSSIVRTSSSVTCASSWLNNVCNNNRLLGRLAAVTSDDKWIDSSIVCNTNGKTNSSLMREVKKQSTTKAIWAANGAMNVNNLLNNNSALACSLANLLLSWESVLWNGVKGARFCVLFFGFLVWLENAGCVYVIDQQPLRMMCRLDYGMAGE